MINLDRRRWVLYIYVFIFLFLAYYQWITLRWFYKSGIRDDDDDDDEREIERNRERENGESKEEV